MGTEDYIYIEDRIILGMVIFLVALAFLFEGVCILIFSLSRSGTKKYLRQSSQENYRRAKSYYIASIVFTVLISLFTLIGIAGFFDALAVDPDVVDFDNERAGGWSGYYDLVADMEFAGFHKKFADAEF